ncbi:hypothetical protein L1987_60271 [Smallanthus sonchifolius]|uniref:Uncharacterized protein n=1 Tax=Smallanthus sonchifolius TaxID=185202 RepID=A0ACB9D7J9_9ASTR|nr:hypothetical protein L1987_60271 [Smallanthus sonchifolius]
MVGVTVRMAEQTCDDSSPQQLNIEVGSSSTPPIPRSYLINGPREEYLKIGVPLYEASITCDWKWASTIFYKYPNMELTRCSITENGETALHVSASTKGHQHVEEFVKNLVDMMDKADLEMQNNNQNTALYLAAAAGNIKVVKIMVEKNRPLLTIAGGNGNKVQYHLENH